MYLRAIQEGHKPLEKYGLITAGVGIVLAALPNLSGVGAFLFLAGIIAGAVGAFGAFVERRNAAS